MKPIIFRISIPQSSETVFDSDIHEFSEIIHAKGSGFQFIGVGDVVSIFGIDYEITEGRFRLLDGEFLCYFAARRL